MSTKSAPLESLPPAFSSSEAISTDLVDTNAMGGRQTKFPDDIDHPTSTKDIVDDQLERVYSKDNDTITTLECETNDGEDSATESLPPQEEVEQEPHDRSDGSDSGLGSELAEERPMTVTTTHLGESDSETCFLDPDPLAKTIPDIPSAVFEVFENKVQDFELPSTSSFTETKQVESTAENIEKDIGAILDEAQTQPIERRSSLKRKLIDEDEEQPQAKKKKRH